MSREILREKAKEANALATPLPTLTLLGMRHQVGLTADEEIEATPLDEAVVRAVERGKSTEVKRRLYGAILLLGGVSRTQVTGM